jgi:hypothetical protein
MKPSAKEDSYESQSPSGRNPKSATVRAIALRDMAGGDWDACPCEPLEWERLMSLVNDSGNLEAFSANDIRDAVEVIRRNPALAEIVQTYDPDFEVHPAAAVLQPS